MVAVELEVMAKKMDRFGWDRDRGSAAHDRLITDWMDALQDYPLEEVQAACRKWVKENPRRMANEGDVLRLIQAQRAEHVKALPKPRDPDLDRNFNKVPADRVQAVLSEIGFAPRKFGGDA